jgi:hypothetical protein
MLYPSVDNAKITPSEIDMVICESAPDGALNLQLKDMTCGFPFMFVREKMVLLWAEGTGSVTSEEP